MKKIVFILYVGIFISSVQAATVYKWVDKQGVVNFTENYDAIPPAYRKSAERINMGTEEPPPMEPSPSQEPAQKKGEATKEVTTDIYGRDETWWKEKIHVWKEKLKEATASYDEANKKYAEKAAELSQKRYGSPTQYKMSIMELDRLREEKNKCEAQVTEANQMLEKLSKEAQETKANPDWLK